MNILLWWLSKIIIGVASLLFFTIGIDVLVASYDLNNPAEFIMYFFSSNLLILVSIVGIIYVSVQIYNRFTKARIHE